MIKKMTKIKIETKVQAVCKKYRRENELLKEELGNLKEMPDFLRGFRK